MTQVLTPYDTGERLEPHPWVQSRAVALPGGIRRPTTLNDYGRVDFDNHESHTVVTMYVTHEPGGYVLHVEDLVDEALSITGGTEAVVIGLEHSSGVEELLSLAQRGREDFLYQASHGDYSDQDQADAATRWDTAQRAADVIRARFR